MTIKTKSWRNSGGEKRSQRERVPVRKRDWRTSNGNKERQKQSGRVARDRRIGEIKTRRKRRKGEIRTRYKISFQSDQLIMNYSTKRSLVTDPPIQITFI